MVLWLLLPALLLILRLFFQSAYSSLDSNLGAHWVRISHFGSRANSCFVLTASCDYIQLC